MEIVVNDTNIFIDLISIDLLDEFFRLPIEVHTVDFVLSEIKNDVQSRAIYEYISNKKLIVGNFTSDELLEVYALLSTVGGNLSLTDCSVLHYAKCNGYTLLTGDRQLRNKAIYSDVEVKGVLFIFDQLVENNIVSPKTAAIKLGKLLNRNPRLPSKIAQERIDTWTEL